VTSKVSFSNLFSFSSFFSNTWDILSCNSLFSFALTMVLSPGDNFSSFISSGWWGVFISPSCCNWSSCVTNPKFATDFWPFVSASFLISTTSWFWMCTSVILLSFSTLSMMITVFSVSVTEGVLSFNSVATLDCSFLFSTIFDIFLSLVLTLLDLLIVSVSNRSKSAEEFLFSSCFCSPCFDPES